MRRCYTAAAIAVVFLLSASSNGHAQWIKKTNFPGGSTDAAIAFAIDGKLYFGGGAGAPRLFYQYDPSTNKWTKKANLPTAKTYRGFGVGFAIGSKGYTALGQSDANIGQASVTNDLWEYDPTVDAWTRKADFPGEPRDGAFAFVIGAKAYVGAGVNSTGSQDYSDFYEYDPAIDKWTPKTDVVGSGLAFPMAFAIGGKGYVVAGGSGAGEGTDGLVYDPVKDEWNGMAPFPGDGREAGIGYAIDTLGYVGLGEANYTTTYSDLYAYDPTKNSWSAQPGLPYPNGVAWPAAAVVGNAVYVGGGTAIVGPNLVYVGASMVSSEATSASVASDGAKSEIGVYPNPTSGAIRVSVGGSLTIEDELGRRVIERGVMAGETVDLGKLSAGLYRYELRSEAGEMRGSVVRE